MRSRERVLQSLEKVYRAQFEAASEATDEAAMARLDLDYQRDQLQLEVLLDIRELLLPPEEGVEDKAASLLEKANKLRRLTKLR